MDNKYIHSPYNAPKEAQRIIEQQIGDTNPLMIIVVEPAIGYLIPALRERYATATLVALHFHSQLYALCQWKADQNWHAQAGVTLRKFLFDCISQLPSPRVAIVIPPYVHDISQPQLRQFNDAVSDTVRAVRSEIATVGYFGKKWIANSIANFLFYDYYTQLSQLSDYAIAIVGSGPTLNATVGALTNVQDRLLIFALPSALPCLNAYGVTVDMVINTDGGFWATTHFQRRKRTRTPRLAMPLTAARELYKYHVTAFMFNQNFCIERALVSLLEADVPTIQSHGTVAASAVELAIALHAQQVLLFGIDGAYIDSTLHCRPHGFERYYTRNSSLLASTESELVRRLLHAPRAERNPRLRISHAHTLYRQELHALLQRAQIPMRAVSATDDAAAAQFPSIAAHRLAVHLKQVNTDKEHIFIDTAHQLTQRERQTAVGRLLRSYRQRIEETSFQQQVDSEVSTLMCALAAQHFHAFWKTMDEQAMADPATGVCAPASSTGEQISMIAATDILERNLSAIAQRFPDLHRQLQTYRKRQSEGKPPRYRYQPARRDGVSIQVRVDSRWIWMYSSIDPRSEATKAAAQIDARQTEAGLLMICVTTLGNGYLIQQLIHNHKTADIVVIECDKELLCCALAAEDLTAILLCPHLTVLCVDNIDEARTEIYRLYVPALHGQAHVVWNEPLAQHSARQRELRDAVRHTTGQAYAALSIYKKLGRTWFRNILLNGRRLTQRADDNARHTTDGQRDAQRGAQRVATEKQNPMIAAIAAAGPGLDLHIPLLRANRKRYDRGQYMLISTDSALSALRQQCIAVDACVTLDGQLLTYLHFIGAAADSIPLYADLAIHPVIYRGQRTVIPMAGSHPLSLLIGRHTPLYALPTRAEHVTQSAFALAAVRLADTIILYGADYGYMSGKAYARGTYIPTHYMNNSNCLRPFELQSLLFSWQYNDRPSTVRAGGWITPQFFAAYKEQLLRYAAQQGYALTEEDGRGMMTFTKRQLAGGAANLMTAGAGNAASDTGDTMGGAENTAGGAADPAKASADIAWADLITQYLQRIRALPIPQPPYLPYLRQLSNDNLLTLLSLLPLMVHIDHNRRWKIEDDTDEQPMARLFARTRAEIERQIGAVLR